MAWIEEFELAGLADVSAAELVRTPTQTQTAVDGRVRVGAKPAVEEVLADHPEVIEDAAAAAAELAQVSAGLVSTASLGEHTAGARFTDYTVTYPANDTYVDKYPAGEVLGTETRLIPTLDDSGRVVFMQMPMAEIQASLANLFATLDAERPFSEVHIGESVRLREVRGARGHRLQYTSRNPGDENARPYMEVNASDEDVNGDVIAGYQSHVTGDGTTPNSGERVYWFLEAHGLQHTVNGNPDFEGWYSMGVANRAEITDRGKGRAFILDAGNRPGFAFHFYKPYIELQTNTAISLDDRARPAIFDGVGTHHSARTVGTIHGGDYINFRREGQIGARFTTVHDSPTTAPAVFMGRSRGTVPAPADVQQGDRLGALQAGTQSTISEDYVHIPGGGSDPRNRKHVTTQILSVATENYTPGTAQGARLEFQVTPNGSASLATALQVEEPAAAGDTSILIRANKDGSTSQVRVLVGAPDSGGPGLRALTIPN